MNLTQKKEKSCFLQSHKVGNVGVIANFVFPYFSPLFATNDVIKCEIRNQGIHDDYISRLHALCELFIFNGRAKTKLAMLAFLYYGEFVKNSKARGTEHTAFQITFMTLPYFVKLYF